MKPESSPPKSKVKASAISLLLTTAAVPLGRRFVSALSEMQRIQWSTREELQARSEMRLATLLKHASENVPYYRDLYRQLGLRSDSLRDTHDLKALPTFTKSDYRNRDPGSFRAANVDPGLLIERTTSGSTGEPFQFSLDRRAVPIIFASHLFYDSWCDLGPFDRYVRIVAPAATQMRLTPSTASLKGAMTGRLLEFYERLTQERIFTWEVDSQSARNIWRRIEDFRPKFVMGYTSTLAGLAHELHQNDLRLTHPVRGVITIAETLTPNRRKSIEDYFNAPIINRYGLRELGSWSAQSCQESPDLFHVNTELVVCETLREDGKPCEFGERGRIVLTDLHNFARPFIRYDTGDFAIATEGQCGCGRGFPLLGPIEGRSVECLRTPSGAEISPAVLGHFLFVHHDHVEAVQHYQLVQEALDRVRLLVVPGANWNDERRARLQADLAQLMGTGMEVNVDTVVEIPAERSGKRPIIKVVSPADSNNITGKSE